MYLGSCVLASQLDSLIMTMGISIIAIIMVKFQHFFVNFLCRFFALKVNGANLLKIQVQDVYAYARTVVFTKQEQKQSVLLPREKYYKTGARC